MIPIIRWLRSHRSSIGAVLALCALAAGVRISEPAPPANLLMVTLDTTRADRLSPYGFQSPATPAIERLAREGIVFLQTITVAPLTLPAHCSLMTGLYPPHHGVRDNADDALTPVHPTLAQVLHRQGFQTAAFVAASVLAGDRGLARGFDVYRDTTPGDTASNVRRPANEVVDDALTWLNRQHSTRFFVWVHLYDAHAPYRPPEPYRTRFATDPYEGSLAFMDAQVDRLVHWLDTRHQLTRTLVVVAGDHGESLGDHGELEHGIFVYDSVLHVPLIMRVPGVAPRRFVPVTSLVDVMPTILGLLRLRSINSDGVDLTAAIRGAARAPERPVYSESLYPKRFGLSALRTIRDGTARFIEAPRPELYDLMTDPFEERNLYKAGSATLAAMRTRLESLGGAERAPEETPSGIVSDDVRERLAALGYISGARRAGATAGDPKDYIEMYNATRRARNNRLPYR